MNDICFATFAKNEKTRLPVWLKYYQQFISNEHIYVIDQSTTDGSTDNLPCNIIYEPNLKVFDHKWLREMITKNILLLLKKYRVVVMTECDELIITRNNEKLDEYLIKKYKNSNMNGYSLFFDVIQQEGEPDYDPNIKINKQRKYWHEWKGSVKHTIYTRCNREVENGFHGGDGAYDSNLITMHVQSLNKQWFFDKFHQRIADKDKYGKGDNHGCWDYYTYERMNMEFDKLNNVVRIMDDCVFKNNYF